MSHESSSTPVRLSLRRALRACGVAGVVACALFAAAAPAVAQVGSLEIVVLDAADGEPLPGVRVTLEHELSSRAPSTALTDLQGRVDFPVLPVGSGYVVDLDLATYARQRLDGLRVRSNQVELLRIELGREITESVRVVAQRGAIDLERTGASTKFSDEFIAGLPVLGRFYQNLLVLSPGVKDADGDGNPNVHGARSRDFKATVSGVSNVDPLTGQWLSFINPESIEELEVLTSGAGAEFGRAQGGFARILQKQGTNQFEGVASLLYRSSRLDGHGAAGYFSTAASNYEWLQPGLQLSGPIIQDRLWYRLSHERIDREDPLNLLSRFAIVRRIQNQHADQLTWQVSPRHKLALQYLADPLRIENLGVSTSVPAESSQLFRRVGDSGSLTWTVPQSARLLVDTIVAYQDHRQQLRPTTRDTRQSCVNFGNEFTLLNEAYCLNLDNGLVSGSNGETALDNRQRFTLSSQAALFVPRLFGVGHRLKVGLSVENERYFRNLERRPTMTFLSEPVAFGPFPRRGDAVVTMTVPPASATSALGTSLGAFVEDQFKPAAGVVVTLGVRLDREEIDTTGFNPFDPQAEYEEFLASRAQGQALNVAMRESFTAYPNIQDFQRDLAALLGLQPDDVPLGFGASQSAFWVKQRRFESVSLRNTNVSPRFAVAWDPWQDGRTKLALTAGRYYDKIFLAVPTLELEPPQTILNFEALFTGEEYIERGLNVALSPTVGVQTVDRNLRTPYQDEISLSAERALGSETSLRLSWIKRRYRDQLQDRDVNHATGDRGRCLRPLTAQSPVVIASPGSGQEVRDPYAGGYYIDTDPGPGDGRIDDCTGDLRPIGGTAPLLFDLQVPDGLPDLYVLNPGWGDILLLGNFNQAEYGAVVLELVRRMHRDWELTGSYTVSRATGDAEDFDQLLGNESTLVDDERGYLSYDQRHVVRLSATTLARWGVRLGGSLGWESGLPYSLQGYRRTVLSIPPEYGGIGDASLRQRVRYLTRRRNDQRNVSAWNLDVKAVKDVPISSRAHLQLTAEAFNLFGEDTLVVSDITNGRLNGERRIGRSYQLGVRLGF